jgi:hypothetical protein
MPDVKTRSELLAAAREIVEKAKIENRGLSADEQSSVDSHLDAVRARDAEQATDARAAADAKSKELLGALDQMASGRYQGQRDDSRRLCFGKSMSESAARKILAPEYGGQIKALAPSGSVLVDQEFSPDPISLGRVAQGLLDVLPVRQHSSPEYAFIRQGATGRTVNAAVVAPGALKPTSPLGLERDEQPLSVGAHLSELINRYWLLDAPSVAAFIDAELRFGLSVAVEAKVVADINATSGVQNQAYSTSVLQTIRKSITKLEITGYAPAAIVMHPTDFEGVELALSSVTAVEHLSLPFDAATRRLFGTPIVATVSEAAGVAHVIGVGTVVVDTDTRGISLDWSENATADSFAKNMIIARCEGRFGTSVLSPLGIVSADLTA